MERKADVLEAAERIVRGAEEDVTKARAILIAFTRKGHQPAIDAANRNLQAHVRFLERAQQVVRRLKGPTEIG